MSSIVWERINAVSQARALAEVTQDYQASGQRTNTKKFEREVSRLASYFHEQLAFDWHVRESFSENFLLNHPVWVKQQQKPVVAAPVLPVINPPRVALPSWIRFAAQ